MAVCKFANLRCWRLPSPLFKAASATAGRVAVWTGSGAFVKAFRAAVVADLLADGAFAVFPVVLARAHGHFVCRFGGAAQVDRGIILPEQALAVQIVGKLLAAILCFDAVVVSALLERTAFQYGVAICFLTAHRRCTCRRQTPPCHRSHMPARQTVDHSKESATDPLFAVTFSSVSFRPLLLDEM